MPVADVTQEGQLSETKPGTLAPTRGTRDPFALLRQMAAFSDGVLEVSVPVPARPEANVRKVQIEEPKTAAKSAA